VAESVSIGATAVGRRASPSRDRAVRILVSALVWAFVLGNVAAICWLWVANHNLDFSFAPNWWATLWNRVGGLTGLLGGFLALVQVLLLARLPFLGRTIGFDHLTLWHRWNGYLVVVLCVVHTVLAVQGRAMDVNQSFFDQFWGLVAHDLQVGMVTATIGLGLFLVVTVTSIAIVRRGMRYELWYWVHLTAYAGIAFAWFHQIPTGGDINGAFHPSAETYWRVLFFGTIGVVILFRVVVPIGSAFFYRLRVTEVIAEGPNVTSIRITGHHVGRLRPRPGQFFLWRFFTGGFWWTSHPFSLSEAPDGRSLRISVKAAGDHTSRMATIPFGTRVVAEGPYGAFTESERRRDKALLIAGGIGITPVRALVETMDGDLAVIYRVLHEDDIVFADELAQLADRRDLTVRYVVGDHLSAFGRDLLSTAHLRELVPDIADRDVFLCGPPAMVAAIEGSVRRAGVPRRCLHVERFAL
jgi:predicted ferric reductase